MLISPRMWRTMGILADMRAALGEADRSDGAEWYWLVGCGARGAIHADLHNAGNETAATFDDNERRPEIASVLGLDLIDTNAFEGWELRREGPLPDHPILRAEARRRKRKSQGS